MKALWNQFMITYFKKDMELNVKLFIVLGFAGILIGIFTCILDLIVGMSKYGPLIDFVSAISAFFLIMYVNKSGRYILGFVITIVSVFMGIFTVLYFQMGGYAGSMPYFYVLGYIFTFLFLSGKVLIITVMLQTVFYIGVCFISYLQPQLVTPYNSEFAHVFDIIVAFVTVGISIGLILFFYVNTYRKQQQEILSAKNTAENANESKTMFMANISHEIRTPINSMLGFDEMILRESEDDQILEYGEEIRKAGQHLLELVNQILNFTRIETGKMEISEKPYCISMLFEEIINHGRLLTYKKGLDFEFIGIENVPKYLYGDRTYIRQIFYNLLENAVKYTEQGKVTIEVHYEASEESGILKLKIQDTGIGINEEDQKNIFQAFQRMDSKHNEHIEGFGLGLTITKQLLKVMGEPLNLRVYTVREVPFMFPCLKRR